MAIDLGSRTYPVSAETSTELVREYESKTANSRVLADRAQKVMPGGETRTITFHPPYPLTGDHGSGHSFTDVDGNTYIDLINNYTSLLHGHAHPVIEEAVKAQLSKGTTFATALEPQIVLGEILTSRVKSVEMVRYTNSGTEATMNAVRVARAFTGREVIIKMEGGYHGSFDDFEISVHPIVANAGDATEPIGTIDTRGVVTNTLDNVVIAPFNDSESLSTIFNRIGNKVAAIIIEPVMGSAGVIPADREYLVTAQELARKHGALFIADEVMTFRLGYGGVQESLRGRAGHHCVRQDHRWRFPGRCIWWTARGDDSVRCTQSKPGLPVGHLQRQRNYNRRWHRCDEPVPAQRKCHGSTLSVTIAGRNSQ